MVRRTSPLRARSLGRSETELVGVGVGVVGDVYEFEGAKVNAVGVESPGAVEEVGVEDLQGERNPAAGGAAREDAGAGLADGAELLLDVRDQFLRDGVTVGTVVGGVHLIRVAERAVAVELEGEDELRGVFFACQALRKSDLAPIRLV